MNSPKPFLIRAFYEWILENEKTPYILVETREPALRIPEQFLSSEKVALNLSSHAVRDLRLGKEIVEFNASFSGILSHVVVPVRAIEGIYAQENKLGMMFVGDESLGLPGVGVFTPGTLKEENTHHTSQEKEGFEDKKPASSGGKPGGKPHLTVIK